MPQVVTRDSASPTAEGDASAAGQESGSAKTPKRELWRVRIYHHTMMEQEDMNPPLLGTPPLLAPMPPPPGVSVVAPRIETDELFWYNNARLTPVDAGQAVVVQYPFGKTETPAAEDIEGMTWVGPDGLACAVEAPLPFPVYSEVSYIGVLLEKLAKRPARFPTVSKQILRRVTEREKETGLPIQTTSRRNRRSSPPPLLEKTPRSPESLPFPAAPAALAGGVSVHGSSSSLGCAANGTATSASSGSLLGPSFGAVPPGCGLSGVSGGGCGGSSIAGGGAAGGGGVSGITGVPRDQLARLLLAQQQLLVSLTAESTKHLSNIAAALGGTTAGGGGAGAGAGDPSSPYGSPQSAAADAPGGGGLAHAQLLQSLQTLSELTNTYSTGRAPASAAAAAAAAAAATATSPLSAQSVSSS
eukprot:Rhum_TRINITY_DN14316_c18_g1::Rhum_TRINITY_DN14316_c18_g1_i1::g.82576::m.82576